MKIKKNIALWPLVLCGAAFAAEPDAAQKQIADEFASRAVMSKVIYDEAGNVQKLAISNHPAFWKDKTKPVPPGVNDELFKKIAGLPKIDAIFLERQPLSDSSYQMLANFKNLKDVRLHYVGNEVPEGQKPPTPDFPLFINELPGLKVLEIKHNFKIDGGCMEKLKPQTELEKLELDTGYATSAAVPFIKAATKLKNLQLHRTTMNDAQFQDMLSALPELEVLEVKPVAQKQNPITGKSLRGLKNTPKLQVLQLVQSWKEMPFEGGLDTLVGLKDLKQINIMPTDIKGFSIDDPAVQKLHAARPDILISVGRNKIGGAPDYKPRGVDAGYDWGGEVTTHG